MSAVIHAVIYGAVFKMMRQMTTGEAIVLAVVVIAALLCGAGRGIGGAGERD